MTLLLLISALLLLIVMEARIWGAVLKLVYRTGHTLAGPAKQKDGPK